MQHLLHPSIPADFISYLVQAGFKHEKDPNRYCGSFRREKVLVYFNHLKVRVVTWGSAGSIDRIHDFTEIHKLDFFQWVLLLEVTAAMPLKEFIGRVSSKELARTVSQLASRIEWPAPGAELEAPTLALHEQREGIA